MVIFISMFSCGVVAGAKVEQEGSQVARDLVEPVVDDAQTPASKPERQVRKWTRGFYSRELSARTSGAMERKSLEVDE